MGFFKFIVISFLVLYIIRVIIRLIFPSVLRGMVNNMQEQARNQQAGQEPRRPEGSINIDYVPPRSKPNPKPGAADKLGEFVDYEEIK